MAVTAKVTCTSKNTQGEGDNRFASVQFTPDYMRDGVKVNEEWALATPHLNLQMTLNGRAADLFEQGKHYTLTFTEEQ